MRITLLLILLAALLLVRPAAADEPATRSTSHSTPVNATCPVMPGERIDAAFSVEHNGRTIGLCCKMCRTRFERDPERFLPNLIVADAADATDDGNAQHEHEHGHGGAPNGVAETGDPDHNATPHKHGQDAGSGFVGRLLGWLGKAHPAFVSFPVALLTVALLADGLWLWRRTDALAAATRFSAWVGGLTAPAAALLGWFYAGFDVAGDDWLMATHRWLGTATGMWGLAIVAALLASQRGTTLTKSLHVALLLGALLVGLAGFFGGALVFGIDHYAWN